MKKAPFITIAILLFVIPLTLISCDILFDDTTSTSEIESAAETTNETVVVPDSTIFETEEAPTEEEASEEPSYEESTREPTVDTSEEPTDEATTASAETSAEEITEEITEETTEEPTEEPTTCTDEYPQDVIDQLIAEGDDIEKLVFSRGPDLRFQYVVFVNKRVLRHGETLEIEAVDCVSGFGIVNMKELYQYFSESPWIQSPLALRTSSFEYTYIHMQDDLFVFTVPADMEPGIYDLWLDLNNENAIEVCKIVIY